MKFVGPRIPQKNAKMICIKKHIVPIKIKILKFQLNIIFYKTPVTNALENTDTFLCVGKFITVIRLMMIHLRAWFYTTLSSGEM